MGSPSSSENLSTVFGLAGETRCSQLLERLFLCFGFIMKVCCARWIFMNVINNYWECISVCSGGLFGKALPILTCNTRTSSTENVFQRNFDPLWGILSSDCRVAPPPAYSQTVSLYPYQAGRETSPITSWVWFTPSSQAQVSAFSLVRKMWWLQMTKLCLSDSHGWALCSALVTLLVRCY